MTALRFPLAVALALLLAQSGLTASAAEPDPDVARLGQRLQARLTP